VKSASTILLPQPSAQQDYPMRASRKPAQLRTGRQRALVSRAGSPSPALPSPAMPSTGFWVAQQIPPNRRSSIVRSRASRRRLNSRSFVTSSQPVDVAQCWSSFEAAPHRRQGRVPGPVRSREPCVRHPTSGALGACERCRRQTPWVPSSIVRVQAFVPSLAASASMSSCSRGAVRVR
jgi:hypothetical protein